MSEPENITQEDWDRFREAAANLGEALKEAAEKIREGVREIDWEALRENLAKAREAVKEAEDA